MGWSIMKNRQLLYLIGIPGSGKSTVMRQVLEGRPFDLLRHPFQHEVYGCCLAYLGTSSSAFPGTDRLPMDVQPRVLDWLESCPYDVVGEGDRLANEAFFTSVQQLGFTLTVALLDTPRRVAADRRFQRGSRQDAAWVKGRETKIERLSRWATFRWILDGLQPPAYNARRLASHSAFETLYRPTS